MNAVTENVVRLDQPKLKEITNASDTATVAMLSLALRERARDVSNVTALRDQLIRMGEKIVDEDYTKFWNDLETAGIGRFIAGRRGNPDRFKWHYSLKEIATAAVEDKQTEVKQLAIKKEVKHVTRKRRAKRKPGRPKGFKVKRGKRGPGRPKGSKNKSIDMRLVAKLLSQLQRSGNA